jgi:hypothetical protein
MDKPTSRLKCRQAGSASRKAFPIAIATFVSLLLSMLTATFAVLASPAMAATTPVKSAQPPCGALMVAGTSWLGGHGVNVYSNGTSVASANDCSSSGDTVDPHIPPVQYGNAWQCVELIERLYITEGWINKLWPAPSNGASSMYTSAPGMGLGEQPEGQITSLKPGDAIVFNTSFFPTYGHIAVVGVANGPTGQLYMQNTGENNGTGNNSVWNYSFSGGAITVPGIASASQITGAVLAPYKAQAIVNQVHGLCLDAAAQTDGSNGGTVQLWQCVDDPNQQWARNGNELVNQTHGLCLDAAAQTDGSNGGTVQLWQCMNDPNQQWVQVGTELVNQANGLCLDANGSADASDGDKVQLWACWNGANQGWTQDREVVNQVHGLCLDAAAQTDGSNGGTVQLWQCVDDPNQQWARNGNELVNQTHGLCLDAAAQTDGSNGGTVQLWQCMNDPNQQWVQVGTELVNQANGLCLDANGSADASDGDKVQLWACWNGANQGWIGNL